MGKVFHDNASLEVRSLDPFYGSISLMFAWIKHHDPDHQCVVPPKSITVLKQILKF